jgi:pimeloyl-ACP methyl ester carboxylesterase
MTESDRSEAVESLEAALRPLQRASGYSSSNIHLDVVQIARENAGKIGVDQIECGINPRTGHSYVRITYMRPNPTILVGVVVAFMLVILSIVSPQLPWINSRPGSFTEQPLRSNESDLSTNNNATKQRHSGGYYRHNARAQSVIIFVHGVLGDSINTWTNDNGAYWPRLLSADSDFDNYDIYVYEYPTSFFGKPFSISEISENMRLKFDADGVPLHKEIIFIAHSMGGLACRSYLLKYRNIAAKTRLMYFYSTPSTGSELASLARLVTKNPQLANMTVMESGGYLSDQQLEWMAAAFDIPSFCAYETQATFGIQVVTQASASNMCNRRLDPINADHISIVKPASVNDDRYLAFKSAVMQTPGVPRREVTPPSVP